MCWAMSYDDVAVMHAIVRGTNRKKGAGTVYTLKKVYDDGDLPYDDVTADER
jgi:hypothetical protein